MEHLKIKWDAGLVFILQDCPEHCRTSIPHFQSTKQPHKFSKSPLGGSIASVASHWSSLSVPSALGLPLVLPFIPALEWSPILATVSNKNHSPNSA